MSDIESAKRVLARLVADDPVADAETALRDLDRAAAFRESGGLDRLRTALATAEGERAARGREALAAFERFRRVAAGESVAGCVREP